MSKFNLSYKTNLIFADCITVPIIYLTKPTGRQNESAIYCFRTINKFLFCIKQLPAE